MHRLPPHLPLLALVFALFLNAPAKDTTKAPPYFDPKAFDYAALLDPGPTKDQTNAEIDKVVQIQAAATNEQKANARKQEHYSVELFADITGSWFKPGSEGRYQKTQTLIARVNATASPIITAAKIHYDRLRPFQVSPKVKLGLEKAPDGKSYPSGHATAGTLHALVLAELAPELKDALKTRGEQIGDDRVVAGAHFPTDVEAGRKLGQAIFDKLEATPEFKSDLAAAQAEVQAQKK
jgi:acid phosphatase (class A)